MILYNNSLIAFLYFLHTRADFLNVIRINSTVISNFFFLFYQDEGEEAYLQDYDSGNEDNGIQ